MGNRRNITIEVDDNTIKTLNNAIVAYIDVIHSLKYGCEVSPKFEVLKHFSDEELQGHINDIVDLYKQIEKKYLDVA